MSDMARLFKRAEIVNVKEREFRETLPARFRLGRLGGFPQPPAGTGSDEGGASFDARVRFEPASADPEGPNASGV